ncbi:GntR family transcriptional regulator [Streptomyces sp. NPDC002851]
MVISKRVEPSPSMTDQVYTVLHELIMNGELPAGARLRIRDLAAEVGTSEMPVREAIRRLEEAGLAERVPHKGAVVKGLDLAELIHVYAVRRLLESEGARLGTQRIDSDGIARMRAQLTQMRQAIEAGEVVAYLNHDEGLLTILYEAAGNPVLLATVRSLWQRCRPYKVVGVRAALEKGSDDSLDHYQERLLQAVVARDATAAAAVNSQSLDNATTRIQAEIGAESPGTRGGSGTPETETETKA